MLPLSKLKGIHPGKIIERELAKRKLVKSRFAMIIGEYPQTLSAITSGTRNLNTRLALRMEEALGWEEGSLMILQVYYDIEQEKKRKAGKTKPDLGQFRPVLFWETDLKKIDWINQRRAIIDRVFSRGNDEEKKAIRNFYGDSLVDRYLKKAQPADFPVSNKNNDA